MDHLKVFIVGVATVTSMSLATAGYAGPKNCNGVVIADDGVTVMLAVDKIQRGPDRDVECIYRANNGWGNGDQDAPGESLDNNSAENNTEEGASHYIHGDANPLPDLK